MVEIRPLSERDHDVWLPLWHGYLEFYGADVDDATTAATFTRLAEDTVMHGAIAREEGGRAVGFVHWLTHPASWSVKPYCYLEDLFVAPDARGTGAGRALITQVRAWAEASGAQKVYWLTDEGNTTARRLYDKVAARSGHIHYEIEL